MNKTTLTTFKIIFATLLFCGTAVKAQTTINLYNQAIFYDGYAALVDEPVPDGLVRLRNDLYTRKLSADEISQIGTTLTINVTIKAYCDNYDRIGNVNLALVPKDSPSYVPGDVQHLEIGRFITPFMNMNVSPDEVPYTYSVDNVAAILKDPALNALYDFWVELQVFGVPYAAQNEIAGCAGHNETQYGSLDLVTDTPATTVAPAVFLLPMSFQADFNNYEANATDSIGTTFKTISFNLPNPVNNAKFFLITSKHGSNAGGEEYIRRWHYVNFDGVQVLAYKPAGISCEPYRVYNTEGNGIYGPTPMTLTQWTSFNNWCPGNVIPIHEIDLGDLPAGTHTFRIEVHNASFVDQQGNVPLSVYLQGEGTMLGTPDIAEKNYAVYPNPTSSTVGVYSTDEVKDVKVYNSLGQLVREGKGSQADLSGLSSNIYTLDITFSSGVKKTEKIIKK
jgi:hypothetical protein